MYRVRENHVIRKPMDVMKKINKGIILSTVAEHRPLRGIYFFQCKNEDISVLFRLRRHTLE